jgi:hypothetical protein
MRCHWLLSRRGIICATGGAETAVRVKFRHRRGSNQNPRLPSFCAGAVTFNTHQYRILRKTRLRQSAWVPIRLLAIGIVV